MIIIIMLLLLLLIIIILIIIITTTLIIIIIIIIMIIMMILLLLILIIITNMITIITIIIIIISSTSSSMSIIEAPSLQGRRPLLPVRGDVPPAPGDGGAAPAHGQCGQGSGVWKRSAPFQSDERSFVTPISKASRMLSSPGHVSTERENATEGEGISLVSSEGVGQARGRRGRREVRRAVPHSSKGEEGHSVALACQRPRAGLPWRRLCRHRGTRHHVRDPGVRENPRELRKNIAPAARRGEKHPTNNNAS